MLSCAAMQAFELPEAEDPTEKTLVMCCNRQKCPQITEEDGGFVIEDVELGIVGDRALRLDSAQATLLRDWLSARLAR